jgi:RNA polymerase sigma-70 factor (ECF subfamily)
MEVRDAEKELTSHQNAERTRIAGTPLIPLEHPVEPLDPVEHLATVYRDYPGLRALIMRRVRDPQVAADILQDAVVTTLEKLRAGKIAQPSAIGGYLYRVALNHLRNHRRKDRSAISSGEDLESLPDEACAAEVAELDRARWTRVAQKILDELPTPRDRDVLTRFYLHDESREDICLALDLTDEHFHRVIFRARNRFRELLERKGYDRLDLLTLVAFAWCLGTACAALSCAAEVAL